MVVRKLVDLVNDFRQTLGDVEPLRISLDRILFIWMFNDIEWNRKGFKKKASANGELTANFAKQKKRRDSSGTLFSVDPERSTTGTSCSMVLKVNESGCEADFIQFRWRPTEHSILKCEVLLRRYHRKTRHWLSVFRKEQDINVHEDPLAVQLGCVLTISVYTGRIRILISWWTRIGLGTWRKAEFTVSTADCSCEARRDGLSSAGKPVEANYARPVAKGQMIIRKPWVILREGTTFRCREISSTPRFDETALAGHLRLRVLVSRCVGDRGKSSIKVDEVRILLSKDFQKESSSTRREAALHWHRALPLKTADGDFSHSCQFRLLFGNEMIP